MIRKIIAEPRRKQNGVDYYLRKVGVICGFLEDFFSIW